MKLSEAKAKLNEMTGCDVTSHNDRIVGLGIADYWGQLTPTEMAQQINMMDECVLVRTPIEMADSILYQYFEEDDGGRDYSMGILTDMDEDVIALFYTSD